MKSHITEQELRPWWQQPLRIIQPNMQVKDTARINPEKLADQITEMGANAMVFNTGGIYAWYSSQVKFHVHNEYLPQDRDLLRELIDSCHQRGIRFIARFDFSKAEDAVYLQRPQWFARKEAGQPEIIGATRPGAWPLIMSTCINGGYRNEELAVPVIREALERYEIDGVFLMPLDMSFADVPYVRRNTEVYMVRSCLKRLPTSNLILPPDASMIIWDGCIRRLKVSGLKYR
ncbi:hypothetical protein P9222_32460 [Paenibacillus amylolyticus]|nr:hypothetical protein [Paenibacillus amylolyticus]WFR62770.1 hypothetical protein P9222_32460 [Paenibacillus amylolyticus]